MLPSLVPVTAATEEPLSLVKAKMQCRVDHADEDVLIGGYIVAARRLFEAHTRRVALASAWDAFWPGFEPGQPLDLGLPGVTAVASLQYLDESGNLQTVSTSAYALDAVAEPARLVLQPGQAWPVADGRRPNAVRARLTAGWPNAAAVPQDVRAWLLLHVQALYERQAPYGDALEPLPYLDPLIAPYRVTRFG